MKNQNKRATTKELTSTVNILVIVLYLESFDCLVYIVFLDKILVRKSTYTKFCVVFAKLQISRLKALMPTSAFYTGSNGNQTLKFRGIFVF